MRIAWLPPLLLALTACQERGPRIEISYDLTAIDLDQLSRLETIIRVDPNDGRQFFVDQPYRAIAQGIGYEVRDVDGDGLREVVLLHEASLGYQFAPKFSFKLLPPASGEPPTLVLSAKGYGPSTEVGETKVLGAMYAANTKVVLALTSTLCGGGACQPNETCCSGVCVATEDDPLHCGSCTTACGANTDSCLGGVCRCNGGAACEAATSCCPGVGCLDLQNDRFNCGACGEACNPGESCQGGVCHCGSGAACDPGGLCCVTDTSAVCSQTGSCACGGSECASPAVCCDADLALCADLMIDDANCGDCGHACPSGLHCESGSCRCNGQLCADGDACCDDGCHTLADDPLNCGQCGKPCGPSETCQTGACHCGSADGCGELACCGNECFNTTNHARNCGGCDIRCQPGEDCLDSQCSCNQGLGCAPGKTCCPVAGCVDLKTDPLHCNSCEKSCPMGYSCISGNCELTTCDPSCAANGNECDMGVCYCSSAQGLGPACSGSLTCCPGSGCVDTQADPDNCGGCSKECGNLQRNCCQGQCRALGFLCVSPTICGNQTCPILTHCCAGCPDPNTDITSYTCVSDGIACPEVVCTQ